MYFSLNISVIFLNGLLVSTAVQLRHRNNHHRLMIILDWKTLLLPREIFVEIFIMTLNYPYTQISSSCKNVTDINKIMLILLEKLKSNFTQSRVMLYDELKR